MRRVIKSFEVHSNESACRKSGRLGLEQVLLHRYNIQDNTGWIFLLVLHFVKRFVWYHSVLSQYSYFRDFYCSWPASRLRDRTIVGYSPPPGQQVSEILWNINITVWLKSQVHHVYFFLMHDLFTPQNTETHYTVIILSY